MPIISAVGLFCYDKFEETPNERVVNMSKLTKPYFNIQMKYYSITITKTKTNATVLTERLPQKFYFPTVKQ